MQSHSVRHGGAIALAFAGLACGAPRSSAQLRGPAAPPPKPTLVVLIAVDQMRADYYERFDKQLTGGLARLYRGGAVFTNAWQDHAITKTEPGHAAMLSGRFPNSTGILAGDRSVVDPAYPPLHGRANGASPHLFRGTSLFDWLYAADSRARALSVSRKDDAAILQLGKARQTVLWYASEGVFTTNRYYADSLPTWVMAFNDRRIPQGYAGKTWSLLLPERSYSERDDVRFESLGSDVTFPHPFPDDPAAAAQVLLGYPQMDSLTAQFAIEGVRAMRLGQGPATDLLAVSFSTTDAVGHRFGPDSRELHDQILRLDRYLGTFIDSLYVLRDSASIVIALTSDHGIQSYPELRAERNRRPAGRLDLQPAFAAFEKQLQGAGVPSFEYEFADGAITLTREPLERARLSADSVIRAFAASLRRVRGVLRVDPVSSLATRDTTRDDIARRWLHMIPSDWPVDLVLTMEPGWYYGWVTNGYHGSPHPDDARVPLVFYGGGVAPGQYSSRALVVDIGPTLAAAARVRPGERVDGRVLSAALSAP